MIKKKIIVGMIIVILLTNWCTIANAATKGQVEVIQEEQKDLTYLYNANFKDRMLQYEGKLVYSINALNEKIKELEIEETREYENLIVKNIILSGYPYKTPEELKCEDEFEAYIATQEAIYMANEPRDLETYVIKGEKGKRIYEAAKQIVQESKKVSSINFIKIEPKSEEFIEDSNYLMKEYQIHANHRIENATIKVLAGEGIKITDLEDCPKTNFKENDTFKVLIPKNNTIQNISIKFEAEFIKLKPILATNSQKNKNYDLVILEEEKEKLSTHIDIKEGNLSTIQITNLEKDTQRPIIGSIFELLNQNYEKLQDNLITDENGKIVINNLEENIYYIRQKQVSEEYSLMNYITKVPVTGTDRITNVRIINSKEKEETIIENNEKEINVEEQQDIIKETNNKQITNIYNANTSKEVLDNIEEKNQYYKRDFISNIRIKNVQNEQNNDIYQNSFDKVRTQKSYQNNLEDNNVRTTEDWINYIELKTSGTSLQKLPKAGI